MNLLLSKEERDKFAAWLENEAATNDGLAKQAEALGGMPMGLLVKKLRSEAMAAKIVAEKLRQTEDMSI